MKTGPIPVSTSSRKTCPDSCPLKNNGCYAEGGPVNIHWQKVTSGERGMEWSEFLAAIRQLRKGTLWRHNQAGDLVGKNEIIDKKALGELIDANKGRRGFTYTHYPMLAEDVNRPELTTREREYIANHNRLCVAIANVCNFTINISANSAEHARKLKALKVGPVVSVVPEDFTTNSEIVVCPATTRNDVSCNSCQLCQKQHSKVIGFPVHGVKKRIVAKKLWVQE